MDGSTIAKKDPSSQESAERVLNLVLGPDSRPQLDPGPRRQDLTQNRAKTGPGSELICGFGPKK